MLLKVNNIHTYYASSHILQGVSLEVDRGEAIALLGRNGVGKTTTLMSIMGNPAPRSGEILLNDENIAGMPSHEVARRGLTLIPDSRRIFPNLTVEENLKLATLKQKKKHKENESLAIAYDYFPQLKERVKQLGGSLSGGELQMLAVARGLVSSPKVMLVDEPTEGLMPLLVEFITERLKTLQKDGLTMLLVETKLEIAFEIAQRVYIMEKGVIKFHGTSDQLLENREIQDKYLGVKV